ncbi:MAG: hypothetical protein JXR37_28020 [Kiritimatiellae bacterium]|nr:hypothetical protein [Kiritimatiellia bacterium]
MLIVHVDLRAGRRGGGAVGRCVSAGQVWAICRGYTTTLQTAFSEAYGDASGMDIVHGAPLNLGRKLHAEIRAQLGIWASIGLAANPMLAQMASASAGRDGVGWIRPGEEERFLQRLPVEAVLGIGRVEEWKGGSMEEWKGGRVEERQPLFQPFTLPAFHPFTLPLFRSSGCGQGGEGARARVLAALHDMNIRTAGELSRFPRNLLLLLFGERGAALHERCHGRDSRRLRESDSPPEHVACEHRFEPPECDPARIRRVLVWLLEEAMCTVRRFEFRAEAFQLILTYFDAKTREGRKVEVAPTACDRDLLPYLLRSFARLHTRRVAVRSLALALSNFSHTRMDRQLFPDRTRARRESLYEAVDRIRARFGRESVVVGRRVGRREISIG